MFNKSLLLAAVVAVALITGIFIHYSHFWQPPPSPLPIVILRFQTPHSGLIHIAQAKGYFTDEGLTVTYKTMQVGPEAIARVLSGEADFATTAETPVAMALAEGKHPKFIATIFSSRWSSGIVARKDHGVLTPEDLKGKRIGFVFGTNTQYDLETFLAFHNIPLDSITMVPGLPTELVAELVSGKIDAASVWVPHMTNMQNQLGDNGVTFLRNEAYAQTINIIVRPDYAAHHRKEIDRFLRALYKAEIFTKEHSNEAYNIIASASGVDTSVLRGHGEPLTYELTLKQSLLIATENQVHWFFRRGLVPNGPFPDILDAFETEPLRAIKPTEVTISK
ncbi:ABC transporter substrate-binding protein [Solimicrobium silvestre]|uniref:ABC-type nitrate/sulfonate/bicarbonate transport systems periplasmic component n=1 Tax=Solimicrobium silvestre TaxID=2099400 RepID=A0A2S9GW52_9BURK|nr:NrtA/SsuA/CpmA family ABC transporter substrate-binding protein [Solimicrobium silvestre]PRC91955.1 ABC-type nitrate/sulfonate/bicarbonate transport systems periplasmic component [Solimicrobium silvestre]